MIDASGNHGIGRRGLILCCVDGSDGGWRALDHACAAARSGQGRLVLLCVVPPGPFSDEMLEYARVEHFRDDADPLLFDMVTKAILGAARARAAAQGCGEVAPLARRGEPAETIVAVARELGAEEIVLGRRRRSGLAAAVLGSVSRKVAQEAPCACTIVPDRVERLPAA
jgi:nucleotide-binding universal stress UspA family protein